MYRSVVFVGRCVVVGRLGVDGLLCVGCLGVRGLLVIGFLVVVRLGVAGFRVVVGALVVGRAVAFVILETNVLGFVLVGDAILATPQLLRTPKNKIY